MENNMMEGGPEEWGVGVSKKLLKMGGMVLTNGHLGCQNWKLSLTLRFYWIRDNAQIYNR